MKKIEENNTLVFIVALKANKFTHQECRQEALRHRRRQGQHPHQVGCFLSSWNEIQGVLSRNRPRPNCHGNKSQALVTRVHL